VRAPIIQANDSALLGPAAGAAQKESNPQSATEVFVSFEKALKWFWCRTTGVGFGIFQQLLACCSLLYAEALSVS
jgi:hypothetical protein